MLTLSNHAAQVEAGQKPAPKRIWPRLLAGVGLGAMVLTVLSFLPGCGSDSTPGGSVKGKNAKPAARAEGVKPQPPVALLVDQAGTVPGKVKQQPDFKFNEVFPGVTREALEAKLAESRKNHLAVRQEVFPGITQADLDARIAANRQKHDPRQMILPGAGTQADYNAARQQVKPGNRQMLPPVGGK